MVNSLAASLGLGRTVTYEPTPTRADMEALVRELAAHRMEHLNSYPVHEAAEHLKRLADKAVKLLENG